MYLEVQCIHRESILCIANLHSYLEKQQFIDTLCEANFFRCKMSQMCLSDR